MCGFIGLFNADHLTLTDCSYAYESLCLQLHRGRDDQSTYINDHVYLGFNRLAINDLEGGSQPVISKVKDIVLLFNGEIYNVNNLRQSLQQAGHDFTTNSEAEVLLTLYQVEGLHFVNQLRGMFAIMIYEVNNHRCHLIRDGFGIKPLYYYKDEAHWLVSSELKAFHGVPFELDTASLQHYFTFQYLPNDATPYTDIKLVTPGTIVTLEAHMGVTTQPFFDPTLEPVIGQTSKKLQEIREVIEDSVSAHLLSDVEVGTFLSGGIDSSIVATCAAKHVPSLKAFTVGFEVEGYSENDVALKTAQELGIEAIQLTVTAQEYWETLPKVIYHLDAPVADPSTVPIYLISEKASEHVSVILSGEGADELFGGYRIYHEPLDLACFLKLPRCIKGVLHKISYVMPSNVPGRSFLYRGTTPLKSRYVGNAFVFNEREKKALLTHYDELNPYQVATIEWYKKFNHLDAVATMQSIDLVTWLRGDILVKSDRLSMAHTLELRVPFLDKEVFNISKTLSVDEKVGDGQTKRLLRESFKDVVPNHVIHAPKKGYVVPFASWLRRELYQDAYDVLITNASHTFFNQSYIKKLLLQHKRGTHNHSRKLFTLIVFNLWYNQQSAYKSI